MQAKRWQVWLLAGLGVLGAFAGWRIVETNREFEEAMQEGARLDEMNRERQQEERREIISKIRRMSGQ